MLSSLIETHKETLVLTERQQSLIVGTLLGDGHLESRNDGRTYRLKIEQGIDQKTYVTWKYDQLKSLVGSPPRFKVRRTRDREYHSLGFTTYSLRSLRAIGEQFYEGSKKVIPKDIGILLDPLALAVWFMDDGSHKGPAHVNASVFHTLGYELDDLRRIQAVLEEKFGLATTVHAQRDRWRLYVPSGSHQLFRSIVEPHMIDHFAYKLSNKMPKK